MESVLSLLTEQSRPSFYKGALSPPPEISAVLSISDRVGGILPFDGQFCAMVAFRFLALACALFLRLRVRPYFLLPYGGVFAFPLSLTHESFVLLIIGCAPFPFPFVRVFPFFPALVPDLEEHGVCSFTVKYPIIFLTA